MTITELAEGIAAARQDADLYARLRNAQKLGADLQAIYDKSVAEQERADAVQGAADLEASYDGITDITVREIPDPADPTSVLKMGFSITFIKPAWNMWTKEAPLEPFTAHGFQVLPPAAWNYLVMKRPERIPASIMALAPGDPIAAFAVYSVGRKRGWL